MRRVFLILALVALFTTPANAVSLLGLKNSLIQFALEQVSIPGEMEITAEGVEESGDGATDLVGLRVADAAGPWLTVERITLRWSPQRILRGELAITRLAAEGVAVLRRPNEGAAALSARPGSKLAETDDDPFDWPRAPITAFVEEIALERVSIAAGVVAAQPVAFDATGALRDEGDEQALRLALRRTDTVAGRIDIDYLRDFAAERLELTLTAEEAAGGLVAELAGFPEDSASTLRMSGTGPLTDWSLRFDAEAARVFAAQGSARLRALDRLSATADFTVTPGPAMPPALRRAVSPAARLRVDIAEDAAGLVAIRTAEITAADIALTARGTFDRPAGIADLALSLRADAGLSELVDGAAFSAATFDGRLTGPADDLTASGRIGLTSLATAPLDIAEASLDGEARLRPGAVGFTLRGDSRGLRLDRIGPETLGEAALAMEGAWAGGTLDLTAFRLTARNLEVSASGDADIAGGVARLDYRAAAADIAPVAAAYGVDAAGAARVEGALSGPLEAPRLTGEAALTALTLGGEALGGVTLTHDATLGAAPAGTVALRAAGSRYGPVALDAAFRAEGAALTLSDLSFAALGATGAGDLALDLETLRAEGRLSARAPDLSTLAPLTGAALAGAASAEITLSARDGRQVAGFDLGLENVAAAGGAIGRGRAHGEVELRAAGPALTASVDASRLAFGSARAESAAATVDGAMEDLNLTATLSALSAGEAGAADATLTARVRDALSDDPMLDARLNVRDAAAGPARLSTAALTAEGRLSALNLGLTAAGAWQTGAALSAEAEGRFDLTGAPRGAVTRAELAIGEAAFALRQPLTIAATAKGARLSPLDLALPGGTLTGEAAFGAGISGDLALALEDVAPVAALAGLPLTGGAAQAKARFDTAPGRAGAQASVSATGLRPAAEFADAGALDLEASLDWDGRAAELTALLSGPFATPMRARATLPVRATDGAPRIPPDGALSGALDWSGDIGDLWALVPAPGHILVGATRVALTLGGVVSAPVVAGEVSLADGRYENLELGTILTRLDARSRVDADGAFVIDVTGEDGAGAPVSASAALSDGVLDARFQATKATLARRDDVTATVTVDLRARGPLATPDISGDVLIDRAEIRLVDAMPPGVDDLGAVRIKGAPPPPPPSPPTGEVGLDIAVRAPQNLFVRGRGLDSEWQADLRIGGAAGDPRVTGLVEKRRGALNLIGARFDLERGQVRFTGAPGIDPTLDIALLRERDGVRGGIEVTGPARDPKIAMVSTPALPQEEVLPRVMFGRTAQSLSPAEAVTLAAGVAALFDGGGGGLDAIRGAIGVDVLSFEGEGADAQVTVGSNVAEGVFVGVTQPVGGAPGKVRVEVDAFGDFSVDSEFGQTTGTSIGLNWRKDF